MLRYTTDRPRPGLVALYKIRPGIAGNGAGQFLQPRSPHGANNKRCNFSFTHSKSSRNRAKDHVLPRYLSGVGRWFTYLNVLWRDCFILSLANYVYACSLHARTIFFSIGLLLFDLNFFEHSTLNLNIWTLPQ